LKDFVVMDLLVMDRMIDLELEFSWMYYFSIPNFSLISYASYYDMYLPTYVG
jgi:hypothetical protein